MKSKITLVAAIAFAVFCLVMVAVGVLTHTEAGLLKPCWNNGVADYRCPEGTPIVWSKIPIRVMVKSYSGREDDTSDARMAAVGAAAVWNDQVGVKLIKIVSSMPAEAVLNWGIPSTTKNKGEGGQVLHFMNNDELSAEIDIINVVSVGVTHGIMVHEFGHLIGLAHDDFKASPMYGSYIDDEDSAHLFVRITDNDRDILRELYVK